MRSTVVLVPGALGMRLVSCAVILGGCACAHGQSVAPSQVTPPSVRPQPPQRERLAPSPSLSPSPSPSPESVPDDADSVDVQVQRVEVEGGVPALAEETRAWARALEGRRATPGELRRQAALLEDAYHRSGYFLVRVTLPPQHLRDGGTLRVVVLDGFIEQIDASGVPERLRRAVDRVLQPLVGKRGLTLHEAERRIRVASNLAGLRLRSALATGEQPGGTRLLLEGELRSVGVGITLDNGLAPSLGGVEAQVNVSLNSPFGQGERFYAALGSGRHLGGWPSGEAPMSLVAAGLVAPIGIEGWMLNSELIQTTLNPEATSTSLRTRGRLSRATVRVTTPVAVGGSTAIDAQVALEHVAQRQDASDFGSVLSKDRYAALRVGLDASAGIERTGTTFTAFTQWSTGLGGRAADPQAPSAPTLSRQGASPRFQRVEALVRLTQPLGHSLTLGVIASGQHSFGDPLMLSEQFALSGQDKVSGYTAGSLATDEGAALRSELSWSMPVSTDNGPRALMAAPYAFAAAGHGRLVQPTAVEQPRVNARSAGVGMRAVHMRSAGSEAQFNLELARVSGVPRDDGRRWQLSLLASVAW